MFDYDDMTLYARERQAELQQFAAVRRLIKRRLDSGRVLRIVLPVSRWATPTRDLEAA